VGSNSLVVHDYEKPINGSGYNPSGYEKPTNVSGYNPSGPFAKNLKTVSAALAYDDPVAGETDIFLVHQAIYIPAIEQNLLSTMQARLKDES
jgi:hypothetical protein